MQDKTALDVTLEYIKSDLSEIKSQLKTGFVSKQEFEPIKKIVYGLVGLILTSVVVAILALVIQSQ